MGAKESVEAAKFSAQNWNNFEVRSTLRLICTWSVCFPYVLVYLCNVAINKYLIKLITSNKH